ncbi:phosphotransferase family protein [Edaphosphingomonas haloaromaticamans]|uniref:Phosphotransferase enzyme family protein n=1 Tax=Edaphosphingomonas haloaromaticamans TaxID=653954 RepID=A0A1S1HI70_9SPHN|nr:phosphotransferase family protein [Sphingomonas haloaromaticamans]OHT21161.1 Phosphotransferase enzyme family protein [Sphingomonas haloaromaticamans]
MPATLSDPAPADPAEALTAAVRRRFGAGAGVDNIVQATLGGSNRTLLFDLVDGNARRRLVSREETFGGEANPFLSPARQFAIMAHVHAAGVPVPEPVFEYDAADALGPGFVTAFVSGETMPRRLLERPDPAGLLRQIAAAAARLHALPVPAAGGAAAGHPLAFLGDIPESGDPVAAMRLRIDALGEPHPALELGLRWLETHRPPERPRALVHGDFRNGNFMVGDAGLAALLDWECTHFGSGVEDLGWLCTRSWRFGQPARHAGGFGARDELIAAYADAGGPRLDAEELRWWERYGLVRWAMYNILQAHGFERGRRSPAYAVCGRNTAMMEYDLLMTLSGKYD